MAKLINMSTSILKEKVNGKPAYWRCNTPYLLHEIMVNPGTGILKMPLTIFAHLLAEVGERATELNDPKLNALMCRLSIYEIADPYSVAYDEKLCKATIKKGGF